MRPAKLARYETVDELEEAVREKPSLATDLLSWSTFSLWDYPWRRQGVSVFGILVAELLLKRTTAGAAAGLYPSFFAMFPDMAAVHASSEDSLADALANVGLQRQRAKAMKALARYLISEHAGVVPRDLESLRNVPGLGEYSSRAVLSFGYGTPEAVVDTNVTRVLHRIFRGALPPRPKQSVYQALADRVLPEEHHREFNFAMLDLGAMVCRYDRPRCEECPLRGECDFHGCRQGDNDAGFNSQLRTIRLQHGIPLARLAARAGVSNLTIINIEHGRTRPRPETVKKLAGALGVSPEKLVSDIER